MNSSNIEKILDDLIKKFSRARDEIDVLGTLRQLYLIVQTLKGSPKRNILLLISALRNLDIAFSRVEPLLKLLKASINLDERRSEAIEFDKAGRKK